MKTTLNTSLAEDCSLGSQNLACSFFSTFSHTTFSNINKALVTNPVYELELSHPGCVTISLCSVISGYARAELFPRVRLGSVRC